MLLPAWGVLPAVLLCCCLHWLYCQLLAQCTYTHSVSQGEEVHQLGMVPMSMPCNHIFSLPDSFRGLEHSLFTAEEDVLHTENKLVDHDLDRCILIG